MRSIACVILFVLPVVLNAMTLHGPLVKPHYDIKDAPILFEKFIKDHNRHYKDEADRKVHYEAFVKTLNIIIKGNAGEPSTVYDINDFADYTPDQRKYLLGGGPIH